MLREPNYPASFEKARRLNAKAAQTVELWNFLTDCSKRQLAEILLSNMSEKHIRSLHRRLIAEGKI